MAQTATLTLTITVENPLSITTLTLPNAVVGLAYSVQLLSTGGVAPYVWSFPGLPAGLACSSSGLISGTPTAAGTTNNIVASVTSA